MSAPVAREELHDPCFGRIVSLAGSRAIVMLDDGKPSKDRLGKTPQHRPEMGDLLAIDTATTVALAIVSALSVPLPAQRAGDSEPWIAELDLVGELSTREGRTTFNRGVSVYPGLGDRVRLASRAELAQAFCDDRRDSVRVGSIRQDPSIAATIRVDELLGKHVAILGTTGTGKSCGTALILRAIVQKNPAAHIVLIDPHNEYAPAFGEWAEVIQQHNLALPFWLLTFAELIEVLIGDAQEGSSEVEILRELIPLAKARYGAGRNDGRDGGRRRATDIRYTVDSPVPYRIAELTEAIDDRMAGLENERDLAFYRNLKTRLEIICLDPRYAFMFGSRTVFDGMTQILGRLFRVPVNAKPVTIVALTGLPSEIVDVVVSALCRLTFDFARCSEGQIPVMFVCEEAHRYAAAKASAGFEPCKRALAKIAKEGRKYAASLCIVSQRPAEIDPTILSQCNTVFALRMCNDRDLEIVASAIADGGSGSLEFLAALGQREAIAFGDGVSLPVRICFDALPEHRIPRSAPARLTERWQNCVGDEKILETIVERWRNASASAADAVHLKAFADATRPEPVSPTREAWLGNDERGNRAGELGDTLRRELGRLRCRRPAQATSTAGPPAGALRQMRDKLQQR